MDFNKIRKTCRKVRIGIGGGLVFTSFMTGNLWFLLGIAPLIAGIIDFCPICKFTDKCELPKK